MKSVVVTGASTGIGWGCVKVLAGNGFHVFGSVRKQADADRTASFLKLQDIPCVRAPNGDVLVPPAEAHGVCLELTAG